MVVLYVCLLVTIVSPAKTAEPIEMPFWGLSRVGPRNHILDGAQVPNGEGAILGFFFAPSKSIVSLCYGVHKNG